jgi:Prealbumin-like fold domain
MALPRAKARLIGLALSCGFMVAVASATGVPPALTNVRDWLAGASTPLPSAVVARATVAERAAMAGAEQTATVTTDKTDYRPGETAIITGSGWAPNEDVELEVEHVDGTPDGGAGHEPWMTSADSNGNINSSWYVDPDDSVGSAFILTAKGQTSGLIATTTFTDNAAASLEQCRNGDAANPNNCLALGGGTGWGTGNVGAQQGHLVEGYSIPYRTIMKDLPANTQITIDLGYDTRNSGSGGTGRNAIDFLTHYRRLESHLGFGHPAEAVDPISGVDFVPGNGTEADIDPPGSPTTFAIPVPTESLMAVPDPPAAAQPQPQTRFNALPAAEKLMTLWGGTIDDIEYVSEEDLTQDNAETVIRVTFTTGPSNGLSGNQNVAVLGWGGHIARCADWGRTGTVCNSATGISGSPYHMRLKAWSLGNLGNQDRSLSAGSVFPTRTIQIIKRVTTDSKNGQFGFSASFNGVAGNFTLDTADGTPDPGSDSITFTEVLAGKVNTVTELSPSAEFTFVDLVCSDPDNGTTADQATRTASIDLDANETVTCTFTNQENFNVTRGKIIVDKVTDPAASTQSFDFSLTGGPDNLNDTFSLTDAATPRNSGAIKPGTYSVAETVPSGWTQTSAVCSDGSAPGAVSLQAGETVTCTFTNTKDGSLQIVKNVINDNGGTATVAAFGLNSSAGALTFDGGVANGTTTTYTADAISVSPGSYTLRENNIAGYAEGTWSCTAATPSDNTISAGAVTVPAGGTVVCTITNNDVAPQLTLVKQVTNDNGGTANAAAWTLNATGSGGFSGAGAPATVRRRPTGRTT